MHIFPNPVIYTVQFYYYITIVNKTYLIIGQKVLSKFLVPYALFN